MNKKIHFIGVGGIGMSALARICHQRGMKVSGSDLSNSALVEKLKGEGISIGCVTLSDDTTVVISTAIPEDNTELLAARAIGAPVLHRSDLLALLATEAKTLAVAGTHGKTTVSSLLTHLLHSAVCNPSFCVGGIIDALGTNGAWHEGSPFVIEADESDGTFVKYEPECAIVTNIDDDHMEHYGSMIEVENAFQSFLEGTAMAFCCGDDLRLQAMATKTGQQTYGFSSENDFQIIPEGENSFSLCFADKKLKNLLVPLPGRHQMQNSAAVVALCLTLGIAEDAIQQGLVSFAGVHRRCQILSSGDVYIIDDYAHHPTEIAATLAGIRACNPEKEVIAIFQPHRFTRTAGCLDRLGASFDSADEVLVTEIYAAGEAPIEGVDHNAVTKVIGSKAAHMPREKVVDALCKRMPNDQQLFIFLGAGDITKAAHEMAERSIMQCSP
jgi:UDP-N-acetylmuramate--alanine ligase